MTADELCKHLAQEDEHAQPNTPGMPDALNTTDASMQNAADNIVRQATVKHS